MEKRKSCPACGGELTKNEDKCPICGLEGLNQLFLSRADYEKWVKEVLNPHMAKVTHRVFAGQGSGLILTGRGELYGIGENGCGQIDENGPYWYEQPHLMAKDVVSAAVGGRYSIYVTRDGSVHLRGRGELAEYFSGFSGAKAVYADRDDRFWILDEKEQVWGFGWNWDGQLQEKWETPVYQFPEAIGTTGYHHEYDYDYSEPKLLSVTSIVWWEKDGVRTARDWNPLDRFQSSDEFQKLEEQYGYHNLKIKLNETYLGRGAPISGYSPPERYRYRPVVYATNYRIYKPVLCPDAQWMIHTPHRRGSKPEQLSQWENWENMPAVKKRAGCWVCLTEDGTVEVENKGRLDWLKQPVADIAVGDSGGGDNYSICLFTCKNGNILWSKSLREVVSGRMKYCRLPEEQ